jgi:hypothetical protein
MPQTITQQIIQLTEEIAQIETAIAHHESPQELTPDPRKYPAIAQLEAILVQSRDAQQEGQAIEFLRMDTDTKKERLEELEKEQSEAFNRLQKASGILQEMAGEIAEAHENYLKAIAQFIATSNGLNGDRQLLNGSTINVLGALIPIHLHQMLAPFKAEVSGTAVALSPGKADFLEQQQYGAIGINPKYLPEN